MNDRLDRRVLPFLWVHGESEEVYREMVKAIYDANIRAFCVEAQPHEGFSQSVCKALDYPKFGPATEIAKPENYALTDKKFSGFIRYETRFTGPAQGLEITDAREGVEAFVNGQSVGIQVVPPNRFDLRGLTTEEGSPLNGHDHGREATAAATETLIFQSEAAPQPSVKITTAKRAYQPGETVSFSIQTAYDKAYAVTATVYKKSGDSWTSTTVAQAAQTVKAAGTDDGTFTTLSYAAPASGVFESYKLVVTVADGGTTVLEVPYYFLAVTQD